MFGLEFGYEPPFFGKATITRAISDYDNQSQQKAAQRLLGEIGDALVEANVIDTAAPLKKDQLTRVKQLTYSFVFSDDTGVVGVYDGDVLHLMVEHYIPQDRLVYLSKPLEYWKTARPQNGGACKKKPAAASAAKKKPVAASAVAKKKPAAASAVAKKKPVTTATKNKK